MLDFSSADEEMSKTWMFWGLGPNIVGGFWKHLKSELDGETAFQAELLREALVVGQDSRGMFHRRPRQHSLGAG